MYGIIYVTTNLINGKKYIGQHRCRTETDDYLGSGLILKKAIAKYGEQNFKRETLRICYSEDELNEMERYYINLYDATHDRMYYNISEGGRDFDDNRPHADSKVIRQRFNAWDEEVNNYDRKLAKKKSRPKRKSAAKKPVERKRTKKAGASYEDLRKLFGICFAGYTYAD